MEDQAKTTKHTFKNLTEGPKGINLPGDLTYMVEKGAEVETETTDAETASAARTGWFEIDGGKYKPSEAAAAWGGPKVTQVAQAAPADPLDHDGNGKKGGSLPAASAEAAKA